MILRRRKDMSLVIVDIQTTGFAVFDRIVEIACVTVIDGDIVDEYETLIQPNWEIGPVHAHGITPGMLESAPEFEKVADNIARRVNGRVLVAHNLGFTAQMLRQEAERLRGGGAFKPGKGLSTYNLTKQKLALAAESAGLSAPESTAISDARCVAGLVDLHVRRGELRRLKAASWGPTGEGNEVAVPRSEAPQQRGSLHRLAERTRWPGTPEESTALYLDALDRCLEDDVLEDSELEWLDETAEAVGLSARQRAELHRQYYELLKERILADGVVTADEKELAERVAAALSIGAVDVRSTERAADGVELEAGMGVCFTGAAVIDGQPVNRVLLEKVAKIAGLRTVDSVAEGCDVLVAADPMSRSGEARKAREMDIPIIGMEDFLEAV